MPTLSTVGDKFSQLHLLLLSHCLILTMWLILYWLLGLPSLLYHLLVSFAVVVLFISYKLFGSDPRARQPIHLSGQLRDRLKLIMRRATSGRASSRGASDVRRLSLAVLVLILISNQSKLVGGLEQDAQILEPVASLAKGIIKTATLGLPLEFNVDPSGIVKNFAYLTWRTGFPVTMPSGFMQKVQDFYNRIRLRVDQADVKDVERKTLASLKNDLDEIVDGIIDEVRQSSDGIYTDYLQTRVNGVPLEDACTAVGIQLRAYGVDLTNYRNIAGAVLGVPIMPTVASAMVNVASMAPNLGTLRNLTSNLPLDPYLLAQLPGSALQRVSSVSNTAMGHFDNLSGSLRNHLSPLNVASPLTSLLNQAIRSDASPPVMA